ncbi:hypothetical protein [Sporolactobacillus laevolacticus]|uniref:hypothetical protein n=1 Tax=Sporolactobacillus laevolacticus TaxID=33018 RepID=UPI0025B493D5|nr:hypothetical protein [Sporolactobacillus laevolacticus]MDN3953676.1 hypothetical protein [Sporolactobacillus laevolacticus]
MSRALREFIAMGCIMTGIFLLGVNLFTGIASFWAIYPAASLLCPLAWLLTADKKKGSIIASGLFLAFCIIQNIVETPDYFWFVYLLPIAVSWPLIVCLGKAALKRSFSYLVSFSLISYYVLLNIYFEPRFLWCIFPIFTLLWWPLCTTFGRYPRRFSVLSAGLIIVFFVIVNRISSPEVFWTIHPIFAVLWWPISMYLAKKPFYYSAVGAGMTILYFSLVNFMTSPQQLWAVYPAFAVFWWPLSVYYFVSRPARFSH